MLWDRLLRWLRYSVEPPLQPKLLPPPPGIVTGTEDAPK